MVTGVDVFNKIKELSTRTLSPNPRILLSDIAAELTVSQNALLVLLAELENRGLIKMHKGQVTTVSLTNYGAGEADPPGGLMS
jgi:Mn-dependent DtxR family transcriptional regulator